MEINMEERIFINCPACQKNDCSPDNFYYFDEHVSSTTHIFDIHTMPENSFLLRVDIEDNYYHNGGKLTKKYLEKLISEDYNIYASTEVTPDEYFCINIKKSIKEKWYKDRFNRERRMIDIDSFKNDYVIVSVTCSMFPFPKSDIDGHLILSSLDNPFEGDVSFRKDELIHFKTREHVVEVFKKGLDIFFIHDDYCKPFHIFNTKDHLEYLGNECVCEDCVLKRLKAKKRLESNLATDALYEAKQKEKDFLMQEMINNFPLKKDSILVLETGFVGKRKWEIIKSHDDEDAPLVGCYILFEGFVPSKKSFLAFCRGRNIELYKTNGEIEFMEFNS